MTNRFSIPITGCVLATLSMLQPIQGTALAGNHIGGKVAPASAPATGPVIAPQNYGEVSVDFWQWEFSLPISHHPLFDTADCSAGQSGKIWFLGGTFATNTVSGVTMGVANRTCTIPAGTWIFFPIINTECSTIPGDNNGDTSEKGLRTCARSFANLINHNTLSVTVDDLTLTGEQLNPYFADSPSFKFGPLPEDNIFRFFGLNAPAGTTAKSASDGVYLMLRPLTPGQHFLHWFGEIDFPDGSKFEEDITYHLTVLP